MVKGFWAMVAAISPFSIPSSVPTTVSIVAMDTVVGTLEGIEKGLIAATIAQKPFTMAFYGLKVLDDLHHHKPESLDHFWAQDAQAPIPMFIDTGATLIDKNNLANFRRASDASRSGN